MEIHNIELDAVQTQNTTQAPAETWLAETINVAQGGSNLKLDLGNGMHLTGSVSILDTLCTA